MNRFFTSLIASTILTGWVSSLVNAGFVHYEYNTQYWDGGQDEPPVSLRFQFDNEDNGIIFYMFNNSDESSGLSLYKYKNGTFDGPTLLGDLAGTCDRMNIAKGSDGMFHLCWRDENGCVWYTTFQNDSIIDPVCLDTAGFIAADAPMIDVGRQNNVHIGFPGGEGDIIYIRSNGVEFQAVERIAIMADEMEILWMDLAVAGTGTVHFICTTPDKQLILWTHDGTEFSDPEPVSGAAPGFSAGKKPWILVDAAGTLYMFYYAIHTRASGMRSYQFYYQTGNRETGFSIPEMINSDFFYSDWGEPRIGPEGEIHLIGIRGFYWDSPPYDYEWIGIHYLWNGLSFAPSTIKSILYDYPYVVDSAVTFDIDSNGNFASLKYNSDNIYLDLRNKTLPDEPFLEISVTPNIYWDLDYKDIISSHLSLYNPGPEPVVAELYLVFILDTPWWQPTLDGTFFFSDQPHFPSFTEDLYSFPIILPGGAWYQNIPLVDIDMSTLGPDGFADFEGTFYAGMVDPETGQLIGNLANARFFYDMNDGY